MDIMSEMNTSSGHRVNNNNKSSNGVGNANTSYLDELLSELEVTNDRAKARPLSGSNPLGKKAMQGEPLINNDRLDMLLEELNFGGTQVTRDEETSKKEHDLDLLIGQLNTSGTMMPLNNTKEGNAENALMGDGSGSSGLRTSMGITPSLREDLNHLMADLGETPLATNDANVVRTDSPTALSDLFLLTTQNSGNNNQRQGTLPELKQPSGRQENSGVADPTILSKCDTILTSSDSRRNISNDLGGNGSTSSELDNILDSLVTNEPNRDSNGNSILPSVDDTFGNLLGAFDKQLNDLPSTGAVNTLVCFECRRIITGESIQAVGNTYHPEHFKCNTCHSPIGKGTFYLHQQKPQCHNCYTKQVCPPCTLCHKLITDKCVQALEKKWHLHCFVCTQCQQPFTEEFFERESRPYCKKCFHSVFSPKCRACNQPIVGNYINALGTEWHPEHFRCSVCHKPFTSNFFDHDGQLYCDQHYSQKIGQICAHCQQPILGTFIEAFNRKWHSDHFICAFCNTALSGSTYTEKNNKAYCTLCYNKLYDGQYNSNY